MYIQSQNQVSCLVQGNFYSKWVLCNRQSNATHVRESYTDFASQTKILPHCFCIYLFQQKTKQKDKYVAVFNENHQEKKMKNSMRLQNSIEV